MNTRGRETDGATHLLVLGAGSPDGLADAIREAERRVTGGTDLAEVCRPAGTGAYRAAFAADSGAALAEQLGQALADGGSEQAPVPSRRPRTVFVFAGQGAQWYGMGRELLATEPVFRDELHRCDRAMSAHVDFSVAEQLALDQPESRMDEIDVLQPTVVSLQIALGALWRSWGVTPDAVVGHSMGEIAAAHVAGALSLEDAAMIACRRSGLLRRITGRGALAVTELSPAEAAELASASAGAMSVAGVNSPRSTVLAGDANSLARIVSTLEARDVYCRIITGTVASHSHYVDELRADLDAALRTLRTEPTRVPFYSTVTCEPVSGRELGAAYWMRNLRNPVRFSQTVDRLRADGHEVFLEISPHSVLLSSVRQCLEATGAEATLLSSGRRGEERRSMLTSLGKLHTLGADIAPLRRTVAGQGFRRSGGAALTPYQAAVLGALRQPRSVPAGVR